MSFAFGYSEERHHRHASFTFGFSSWYSPWYYHPTWCNPHAMWSHHHAAWGGWGYPYGWGPTWGFGIGFGGWHSDLSFYFAWKRLYRCYTGFSVYYPVPAAVAVGYEYPFYRCYGWEPHFYYTTCARYPAYTVLYYRTPEPVVTYVEVADPYVEYAAEPPVGVLAGGDVPAAMPPEVGIDEVFVVPLVADYPFDLGFEEYLNRGHAHMQVGQYAEAAEAFRRAVLLDRASVDARFRMAVALFAAAHFDRASRVVHVSLDEAPGWAEVAVPATEMFPRKEEFYGRLAVLERHLLSNPRDQDARFTLAFVYLQSGNVFAARGLFQEVALNDRDDRQAAELAAEAERRILQSR